MRLESNIECTKLVLTKLIRTFSFYGFKITEEHKNYVQLENKLVVLAIYQDGREHRNNLNLGRNCGNYERIKIDTAILKEYFDIDKALDKINTISFLDFLNQFFEGKGKLFIQGDADTFLKFEDYFHKRNEEYTKKCSGDI